MYYNNFHGMSSMSIVMRLMIYAFESAGAVDPNNAKTLGELHLWQIFPIEIRAMRMLEKFSQQ